MLLFPQQNYGLSQKPCRPLLFISNARLLCPDRSFSTADGGVVYGIWPLLVIHSLLSFVEIISNLTKGYFLVKAHPPTQTSPSFLPHSRDWWFYILSVVTKIYNHRSLSCRRCRTTRWTRCNNNLLEPPTIIWYGPPTDKTSAYIRVVKAEIHSLHIIIMHYK